MIYRIRYTKNREWAALVRPKQEISIPEVVEMTPYRLGMEQSWLLDVDEPNIEWAIRMVFPIFKEYFRYECININEIYMQEHDKEARLGTFLKHLFDEKKAKINGLICHSRDDEKVVVVYSPEDCEILKIAPVQKILDLAKFYIFSESTESPGELWLRV